MKFSLGAPEHGWVNLTITDNEYCLEENISDVPNDFIDDTMIALSRLLTYEDKQLVHLSLEPAFYVMSLARKANAFTMTMETEGSDSDGISHQADGSFEEIILPIYSSVKGFCNSRINDYHWPEVDQKNYRNMVETVTRHKS
ncbi:hypothetical protein ACFFUT_00975 [Pseudohalocynthiibacter aestuariivivens]|uniref:Uncharacterized protein n=1 Tax=Pseudohalocynthiibacter aestuariivivens TaxID=1591409 RepID=A0ABV5JA86_9RHOB|nr:MULTISPECIES: hypothetical protein [Pseudohalocynthiibacter]MBS9716932.1 hypothetical protein [Pseudohalocynthiibacter aestuariivivens]